MLGATKVRWCGGILLLQSRRVYGEVEGVIGVSGKGWKGAGLPRAGKFRMSPLFLSLFGFG